MPKDTTKNDKAWRRVFDRAPVLEAINSVGHYKITAKEVKDLGGREPRLMAKQDTLGDRPKVFQEHQINILPIERARYILFKDGSNDCFFKLLPPVNARKVQRYVSRIDLTEYETLPKGLCSTESEAIDLSFLSSLLATFCGASDMVLTRRGRYGSKCFSLILPNDSNTVEVNNTQLEVDSVFESEKNVVLIEAKIGFRDSFNIRQLFYPLRWLQAEVSKPIVPILLCYSNGEFQISEFSFGDKFGEIELCRQEYFVINEDAVAPFDLDTQIRFAATAKEDLTIPFPQADDIDKVVDLLSVLDKGSVSTKELTDIFDFVGRQADYYRNAARYLGLLVQNRITSKGRSLLSESHRINRIEILARCMIARPVFREAIKILVLNDYNLQILSLKDIRKIIELHRTDISGDTIKRRSYTVKKWLEWLVKNLELGGQS